MGIGEMCKQFRREHGYLQKDVAIDTGYSFENVSAFENGRNDNGRIFLWYLLKGLNVKDYEVDVNG